MVVGAQHQHHVLERDNDRQRPKKDGQDAVHVGLGEGNVAGAKNLFHGIQHARADIAIDDADGCQGQRSRGGLGGAHCNAPHGGPWPATRVLWSWEGEFCACAQRPESPPAQKSHNLLQCNNDSEYRPVSRRFQRPDWWLPAHSWPPTWPGVRSRHTCRSGWARSRQGVRPTGATVRHAQRPGAQNPRRAR